MYKKCIKLKYFFIPFICKNLNEKKQSSQMIKNIKKIDSYKNPTFTLIKKK